MATSAVRPYRLTGPQVEPGASYWSNCPRPQPPTLAAITTATGPDGPYPFPSHPTAAAVIDAEFAELKDLEAKRDDPTQLTSTTPGRERCPISLFLQLRPQPIGAVINAARGF